MDPGLLVLAITVLLVILVYKRFTGSRIPGKQIPGPKGLPLLGSLLDVNVEKIHLSFEEWAFKYGKIFKVSLFGKGIVVLNDRSLIRKALMDDEYAGNYCNHPQTVMGKHVAYGNSDIAFALKYDKAFIALKRLFTKALKKRSIAIVHEELSRFIDSIQEHKDQDFVFKPLIRRSFGNLMSILLSGELPKEQDCEMIWELNDSISFIAENSVNLMLKFLPFLRHATFTKYGRLFQRVIKQRDLLEERYYFSRRHSQDDEGEERGIVDMLVKLQREENKKARYEIIRDDNIKSLLLDIISGGMTSTTFAITSAIGLLAENPKCAKNIQTEIDEVIGQERLPNLADKDEMNYTMAFMLETLRYISHGSVGLPHEVARDHNFEGYTMKKNDIVFTNIWFIHKDPSLWEDPWTFQPERFLDPNGQLVSPNHVNRQNLISFSLGRHSCPGSDFATEKIFLYITSILQTFDISPPVYHKHVKLDPRNFRPGLFLEPEEFFVRMDRRV